MTARKQVRFGNSSMTTVESVPETHKSQVWYNSQELQDLNTQEVAQTQYNYALNKKCKATLELFDLSWRGIENIQKGYDRGENTKKYASHVVTEYRSQVKAFGDYDPEDLRAVAKAHSKKDRVKARKMGLKDAEVTRQERTSKDKAVKPRFSLFQKGRTNRVSAAT